MTGWELVPSARSGLGQEASSLRAFLLTGVWTFSGPDGAAPTLRIIPAQGKSMCLALLSPSPPSNGGEGRGEEAR